MQPPQISEAIRPGYVDVSVEVAMEVPEFLVLIAVELWRKGVEVVALVAGVAALELVAEPGRLDVVELAEVEAEPVSLEDEEIPVAVEAEPMVEGVELEGRAERTRIEAAAATMITMATTAAAADNALR